MEPLRVLHIVHTLNRGGMESRIMDLYRNIDRSRFQFDFYVESGNEGVYDDEVRALGGNVFLTGGDSRFNIPNFRAFKTFLMEHPEYRVVYAYNQWAGMYLKLAKRQGIPHRVANARTSIQTFSVKNCVKNLVKTNSNKYATQRFAVSKEAATWLFGKRALSKGLVKVWPNAIDTERYSFSAEVRNAAREKLGVSNKYVVMHVGNVRFEKNHPFLLNVFAQIKRLHDTAVLILVGGGDRENLFALEDELCIRDSIIDLGVRTDIPELLHAADLFVFPSWYEGFPGAVLEAEASGLNCIISDSITEEVVLSSNVRRLSLSDSYEKWAEAIETISPIERERAWIGIRDAGYDIKNLVDRTEKMWETM